LVVQQQQKQLPCNGNTAGSDAALLMKAFILWVEEANVGVFIFTRV
jgi:hypothetical protein